MPSVTISRSAPRTIKRQYALSLPTKRAMPVPGGPAADALGPTGTAGTLERGPAASSAVIHLPMKESLRGDGGRQRIVPEALAQRDLLDLAGGGVRDLVDESDVVRHPPLGDLALHEAEDLVLARPLILLQHDHEQRPLVPFGMLDADHRG